jgi:hypothetical protein
MAALHGSATRVVAARRCLSTSLARRHRRAADGGIDVDAVEAKVQCDVVHADLLKGLEVRRVRALDEAITAEFAARAERCRVWLCGQA